MKYIVVACFLLFSITIFAQQDSSLAKYQSVFDNELKDWAGSFINFNLKSYSLSQTYAFHEAVPIEKNSTEFQDFLDLYNPILSFSKDKSKIIDAYSYDLNLEKRHDSIFAMVAGEQTVYLYDLKRNTETKLFFLGFSAFVQDVVWLSENKFLIVESLIWDNKTIPIIEIGDCADREIYTYATNDTTCCIERQKYFSQKWDKIKIYDE